MTTAKQAAMADLHAKVQELMDDMKRKADECLDRLQASGADIAGDHLDNGEKVWKTPLDFMAAFAEEIKMHAGCVRHTDTKARQQRIRNYERMM